MSELRKDPIVGRWVIIAKNRADRPQEIVATEVVRADATACPFCEGHESDTPHEIAAFRAPGTLRDQPGWRVRVVPNKFPALTLGAAGGAREAGLYRSIAGLGAHELVIESPDHVASTTQLSDERLGEVLQIYCDRLLDLKQDRRLACATVFKNLGAAAGASIEHAHSQLMAMPLVPVHLSEELEGSLRLFQQSGTCAFCELLERELAAGDRVVEATREFVAFCPFAARFPYETWILPRSHASHYEALPPGAAGELARILKRTLMRIESALARPAYNYFIHSAPFDTHSLCHYHWHMEIIPRVTETAGFEWGAGFYINPVPPEEAAATLRAIDVPFEQAQRISTTKTG